MSLYPWQQQSWEQLWNYKLQNRLPQALLVIGKKGLGKQHLARQFANSLLCTKPLVSGLSCEECPGCLLFKAQSHPDFIYLTPEETAKTITIDQIRKLTSLLSLKPQFNTYRIVLINPADEMNTKSANAFLKYLEEPTERTIVILLAEKPSLLPATIISRCQKHFINIPEKEIAYLWLRQQSVNDNLAVLLGLAQGAPLLAEQYAKENHISMRNDCFKAWMSVAQQKVHPVMVAEKWCKLPENPLIFWLCSWVIDLMKCCYHRKTDSLYNPDFYEQFIKMSLQLNIKDLYQFYDFLLLSRKRLGSQVNRQTLFEEILIKWSELNRSK